MAIDTAKLDALQQREDERRRDVVMQARIWRNAKTKDSLAALGRAVDAFVAAEKAWLAEYDAQCASEKKDAPAEGAR